MSELFGSGTGLADVGGSLNLLASGRKMRIVNFSGSWSSSLWCMTFAIVRGGATAGQRRNRAVQHASKQITPYPHPCPNGKF